MSDYDKIGVKTLPCRKKNGKWVFERDGLTFDLAPAGITTLALSPVTVGVDRLVMLGCKMKNIPTEDVLLLYSEEFFPGADVKFEFKEPRYEGWVYDVEELNLTGLLPGQQAWLCSYMAMFFPTPPKSLYLKIEAKNGQE